MCIQTTIQNKIAELTNDGEDIAAVLDDILRGADPTVKACHRIEAAKLLTKYGTAQPGGKIIPFDTVNNPSSSDEGGSDANPVHPEPVEGQERQVERSEDAPSPSMREEPASSEGRGSDGDESATVHPEPVLSIAEGPVQGQERRVSPTLRDIVAFPVARHIRNRTNDGETLIYALKYIMEGGHFNPDPFTGYPRPTVTSSEMVSAAKELMRRAFGEYSPPRRASVEYEPDAELDAGDPVNSAIAKLAREHTDNGVEAAELLIQVIESDPRGSEWKSSHRLTAAKELLHRAYDLNYDAVTWKDFEDYHRASEEYNDAYEIRRARHKAQVSAILKEYREAYAARDKELMEAIEEKYYAYLRAEKGEDEEIEYAEYGPNDPDPTIDEPVRPPERKRNPNDKRRPAAARIRAPKLTIPMDDLDVDDMDVDDMDDSENPDT